jgi:S-adenosylmethionine uptake transporter
LTERLPVIQVAFLRFAFGSFFAGLAFATRGPAWPTREAFRYNAVRSALVVVTASLFFFALSKLPIAEGMALSFFSPLFIALSGVLLLGERFDARIGWALGLGLVGMAVIVGGQVGVSQYGRDAWLGAVAIFFSAVVYALLIVLLRHRATRDPLPMIVLFQNVGPALLLLIPASFVWIAPRATDLVLFALVGALGVTGHSCLATAFSRAEAARLAPAHYSVLAWGTLFGFVFFQDVPALATVAGAALIAIAVFVTRPR